MERTERNREVKRRAKARKAEGQRKRLIEAVEQSLVEEQVLRDKKAAEHGWPVHPNDVDWLDGEARKSMYRDFIDREPFRPEWRNP